MQTKSVAKKIETVAGYLASLSKEQRHVAKEMRKVIKSVAPKAEEMISYQILAYKQYGVLVYFGVFKNHVGFYPTGQGIEDFKDELVGYKSAKGSVQFPLDKPLPFALIKKIVKYRVEENMKKVVKNE